MLQDTPAVFDVIRCGLGQNSISGGKSGHSLFCWRTCMINDGRRTRPSLSLHCWLKNIWTWNAQNWMGNSSLHVRKFTADWRHLTPIHAVPKGTHYSVWWHWPRHFFQQNAAFLSSVNSIPWMMQTHVGTEFMQCLRLGNMNWDLEALVLCSA